MKQQSPFNRMPKMSKEREIKFLEDELLRHKGLAEAGKPTITKMRYDGLEAKLRQLRPNSPLLPVDKESSGL